MEGSISVKSFDESFIPLTPMTYKPSSVSVPVLSKTMTYTLPVKLTLGGDVQKIFLDFNRTSADDIPTDIVVGKVGGIVIVIRSSNLSIKTRMLSSLLIKVGSVKRNPMMDTNPMAPTNQIESL